MQTHISSQLMDNGLNMHFSPNAPYPQRIRDLLYFTLQKKLILDLGEYEHTGDWDLFLIIELNDGTKLETVTGYPETYWDIDPVADELFMGTDTPHALPQTLSVFLGGDEEPILTPIPISDIKSITLSR